ncbi:hypothetical protein H8I91_11795 [Serratia fonticola]|uniref:hypothetical protein n=1 Tax=Serratia fonticola TaxID=47917 RepID=UPI0016478F21|nr:hypothetical protein [Serratia fonticola]MBC3250947.1 hypothetical protein [Serratia fonticola]
MRFKDLPECTQTTTVAAIIGACLENSNKVEAAKEICNVLNALYQGEDPSMAQGSNQGTSICAIQELACTKPISIKSLITDNAEHAIDKSEPYIYPGDMNDARLSAWLRSVADAINKDQDLASRVESLKEEIAISERAISRRHEIISANVHPTNHNPTPHHKTMDT